MKWMVASDIHGSAYYCDKMIKRFSEESADRLILLGDLLYHGPRNDLPKDYNPQSVIAQLNSIKSKLFCVHGNCDAEVDQMVLEFPILADYAILDIGNHLIFATHGHLFNEKALPQLNKGDILLNGHTHVSKCTEHGDYVYMNPGSVSIPKENTPNGYMIISDSVFIWKDLNGNEYNRYHL